MKRRICLAVLGCVVVLGGCGNKQAAPEAPEAPAAQEATETVEAPAEETTESTDNAGAALTAADIPDGYESQGLNYIEDMVLSTDIMTLTVPDEFKGKFYAVVEGDLISIFDKECVDEGFPGYVFSVVTSDDNDIYVGGMYTKVGEVTAKDGTIYNVSRGYPSEIQWDYNKGDQAPENYSKLDAAAESMIENIKGTGDNVYVYKGGTKGEDIYGEVLEKFITAAKEGWDATKLEEENMTPEFYALAQNVGDKVLDKYGYAYVDINHDGIDDLLLGEIDNGKEPTIIFDVYTTQDRKPAHVVSGSARDRYYALGYGGLANEFSSGAMESGVNVYDVEPNSSMLIHQYSIKYDGYTDEKNPWFVSYTEDEWEPMTEEDYEDRYTNVSNEYMKLELKPLSGVAAGN